MVDSDEYNIIVRWLIACSFCDVPCKSMYLATGMSLSLEVLGNLSSLRLEIPSRYLEASFARKMDINFEKERSRPHHSTALPSEASRNLGKLLPKVRQFQPRQQLFTDDVENSQNNRLRAVINTYLPVQINLS